MFAAQTCPELISNAVDYVLDPVVEGGYAPATDGLAPVIFAVDATLDAEDMEALKAHLLKVRQDAPLMLGTQHQRKEDEIKFRGISCACNLSNTGEVTGGGMHRRGPPRHPAAVGISSTWEGKNCV